MGKLVEHLMRCAVCGAVPKISDTVNIDNVPNPKHCYRLFCSKCGIWGNRFENKYRACLDWNKRLDISENMLKNGTDDGITNGEPT